MNNSSFKVSNPYHEKYPEISCKFSELRNRVQLPWYGKLLLVDFNSYFLRIRRSIPAQIVLSILAFAFVSHGIPKDKLDYGSLIFPWAICFMSFYGLIFGLLLIHQRAVKDTRAKLVQGIDEVLRSIPESSWIELATTLRDMATTDKFIAALPIKHHIEISRSLALELTSNPNWNSKLNAIEYLFADYPYAADKSPFPFGISKNVKQTYYRHLCVVNAISRPRRKFIKTELELPHP